MKLKSIDFKNETGKFIIDTGAELNLIKKNIIKTNIPIDSEIKYSLFGINEHGVKTQGQTKIIINGEAVPFQVVPHTFPIEFDGMVGMPFLSDSVINLKENKIQSQLGNFPISNKRKGVTLKLKARTKQLVTIAAKTTDLNEGYLSQIPTGPGVYLGESLVAIRDGNIQVYCINTSTQDIEISIPPVEVEEFELVEPSPRTEKKAHGNTRSASLTANRHNELIATLDLTNLNFEEKKSLFKITSKFPYQFFLKGDKLGSTNVLKHSINTINDNPIKKQNHRLPKIHSEFVGQECKSLYDDGRIQNSDSPYNSPVWVVPKKPDAQGNRRWRMVIDYRLLNEKTVGDAYPLPNITDILDQLGGAKYFTVLDLASGFHQIEVEPKDRHKTAFSTPFGHFEFVRMPFGLKNAPASFQRVMDRVLSGLQGVELFVYMDDIVIYAKSLKEHQEKLEKLLGRLKTAGLVLQPEKCRFLCKEIGYLGHVITEKGVKPDSKKVEAVEKFPRPTNRKNIKQFLGLAGYYRRFIPEFALIAKPLTKLLKKNIKFHWTDEAQLAFDRLKEILCSEPLLQYPDFSKPFVVTTDSSNFALGAILSQGPIGQDLPISYASCTLNNAELNYTTTEKELLAIIFAIKQFRPYIYGQRFTLVTDHRPLIWLLNLKDPTVGSRLARWKIKLQEYDYEVVYKPGRVNANADALSRNPIDNSSSKEVDLTKTDELNVYNDTCIHEYSVERVFPNLSNEFGRKISIDCEESDETESDGTVSLLPRPDQGQNLPFRKQKECTNLVDGDCHDDTGYGRRVSLPSEAPRKGRAASSCNTDVQLSHREGGELVRRLDLDREKCAGQRRVVLRGAEAVRNDVSHLLEKREREDSVDRINDGIKEPDRAIASSRSLGLSRESTTGGRILPLADSMERDERGMANHIEEPLGCGGALSSVHCRHGEQVSASHSVVYCRHGRQEAEFYGAISESLDSDDIDDTEMTNLKGTWGNLVKSRDFPVECEPAVKRIRIEDCESVVAKSVLSAKQKKGNIILKPLFKSSNDKLYLRNDHLMNFVSCDGVLTTPVGRELMDNSLIKLSDIRETNPELGLVTSVKENKRFIFNLFVKETYDAKVYAKNIELAISTLREAMESMNLKSISVSRKGNGLDSVPWNVIEQIIRTYFNNGGFEICICNGEVITPNEKDRLRIIQECHDSTMAGHKGESKTYERVRERFHWKGMREDIREYVRSCDSCQRKKLKRQAIKLPMKITDTPKRFLEKIQIDLVGPLTRTESGNTHILTWQDCLTKYSGAIPLSKTDAPHVAVAIAENIICVFGCPEIIQTDQGSQFTSRLMNSFAVLFKIKQYYSSAYHPQSLGALERSHHTFVEYLRHYSTKVTWDQWLPYAMFSFNTSVHESTGITPHEAVFGRKVRFPSEFADENVPLTYIEMVDELLNRITEIESTCAARLEAAKQRCKKYYDLKLNDKNFQVGEHVMILIENRNNKLDDYYEGPYKINKILNGVNLEVQISPTEIKVVHMNRVRHAYFRFT